MKIYPNMLNTFLTSSLKAIAVFGEFLLVLNFEQVVCPCQIVIMSLKVGVKLVIIKL